MTILDVPLFFQPRKKPYCAATCAQMVLAHHGVRLSQRRIVRDMDLLETRGADLMKVAAFFLRQGFSVRIVLWHYSFPNRFYGMEESALQEDLLRWSQRDVLSRNPTRTSCKRLLPEYLKGGGRIEARPVTVRDIKAALSAGCPPVLNLEVSALKKFRCKNAGHYVVPVGIRGNTMTMHDPIPGPGGGVISHSIDDVMCACYRWASGAVFVSP